jgi:hypothetical protein
MKQVILTDETYCHKLCINSTVRWVDFRYDKKLGFRVTDVNGIIIHCITCYENEAIKLK